MQSHRRFSLLGFASGAIVTGATTFISLLVTAEKHGKVGVVGLLESIAAGFSELSFAMWSAIGRFWPLTLSETDSTIINASLLFAVPVGLEASYDRKHSADPLTRLLATYFVPFYFMTAPIIIPFIIVMVTGWSNAFLVAFFFPAAFYALFLYRYIRAKDWICTLHMIKNFVGAALFFIAFQTAGLVEVLPSS